MSEAELSILVSRQVLGPMPDPTAVPWHSSCPLFLALFASPKAPNEARVMALRPVRKPVGYFTEFNFLPVWTDHSSAPAGQRSARCEEARRE